MLMRCADCGGSHEITTNDAGLWVRIEPCPADSKQDNKEKGDTTMYTFTMSILIRALKEAKVLVGIIQPEDKIIGIEFFGPGGQVTKIVTDEVVKIRFLKG